MMHSTRCFAVVLCSSCVLDPGLITETASDSSGPLPAPSSGAETGMVGETLGESTSAGDIRLDVSNDAPECTSAWCGFESTCGGPVTGARSLAMIPGGYVAASLWPSDHLIRVYNEVQPTSDWFILPEQPADILDVAIAVSDDGDTGLLLRRADGYLLQARAPGTYAVRWERAHVDITPMQLTATDVAATPDGSFVVVGRAVDTSVGAPDASLFVHGYSADGELLTSWTDGLLASIEPRFLVDPAADGPTIWASVELHGDDTPTYWVRSLDPQGVMVEGSELTVEHPIVDRPARTSAGWVAAAAAGTGLALYWLTEDLAWVRTDYDIPAEAADRFSPNAVTAVHDSAVVFVRQTALPGSPLALRPYDADGSFVELDYADDFLSGWHGDVAELSGTHDGTAYFLITSDPTDEQPSGCRFDFDLQ